MNLTLDFPFTAEALESAQREASGGKPGPLRALCRLEVECFEAAIRQHPDYRDGLVMIERRVVEGYLYQKLRNHIDSSESPNHETSSSPYGNEER
jgi:hypothetical protein